MKKFIIEENILNAILSYLKSKPYAEVAPAITALTQLQSFKEPAEKKEKGDVK